MGLADGTAWERDYGKFNIIDHKYTNEIVCPFCGYEFGDSWEYRDDCEDLGLIDCDECHKSFYATRNITIDYSTNKARYGICRQCNKADTVIEKYTSSIGSYNDFCVDCGELERKRLRRLQFGSIESK